MMTIEQIAKFQPFDEVLITGTAFSPACRVERLHATIATLALHEPLPSIKVWRHNDAESLAGDDGNKVWFRVSEIEAMESV